jgi:hypothetical protein
MNKLTFACVSAMILYFGLLTCFAEHENMFKEFFAAAAAFVVLNLIWISFILGLVSYKRKKIYAFIPCLICLFGLPAGFVGAIVLGESIKAANFKKSLPRYTEVVRLIENDRIKPDSAGQIQLPEKYDDLAYSAFTYTNRDGRIITFLTDGAFPVWHAGYLYSSSGVVDENNLLTVWNNFERVNTNWFQFSD